MDRERVLEQLGAWRDSLVNLTRRNRLLYYKHSRGSLQLSGIGSSALIEKLTTTRSGLKIGIKTTLDGNLVVRADQPDVCSTLETPEELARVLKNLERRSVQDFMERGLWVLYAALGTLHWEDRPTADGPLETVISPLFLVPVRLKKNSASEYRLFRTDDETVLNPALAIKLQNDFGIALPAFEPGDEDEGLEDLYGRVSTAVQAKPTWSVSDGVVVSLFSFHKEVMYRDLLRNAEQIANHDLVQTFALGHRSEADFGFAPVSEDRLDELHPPEKLSLVLDADASQRQCLAAAQQGRSFVMEGPPGTGKSQTIANAIAQALADGKTVLFASEKIAALEVVQSRLEKAGLSEFLLELHSHKATRKRIAQELGRSLAMRVSTKDGLRNDEIEQLRSLRTSLTAYVAAVHELREPLGRSVHGVLAQLVGWQGYPQAPAAEHTEPLTSRDLANVGRFAESLSTAWAPVERREEFIWRELNDGQLSQQRKARLASVLAQGASTLDQMRAFCGTLLEESGLRWHTTVADFGNCQLLLQHLRHRPVVYAESWLEIASLGAIRELIDRRHKDALLAKRLISELTSTCGARWHQLDSMLAAAYEDAALRARETFPPQFAELRLAWPSCDALAARLEAIAENIDNLLEVCVSMAGAFRTLPPVDLPAAEQWLDLAAMAAQDPPEPQWSTALVDAKEARRVLQPLCDRVASMRSEIDRVFSEDVLALDVEGLSLRFSEVHLGLAKYFRPSYWRDRRVLKSVSRSGQVRAREVQTLSVVIGYRRAVSALAKAETAHSRVLGSYYDSTDTDFARLERAIGSAEVILQKASVIRLSVGVAFEVLGRDSESRTRLLTLKSEGSNAVKVLKTLSHDLPGFDAFTQDAGLAKTRQVLLDSAGAVRRLSEIAASACHLLQIKDVDLSELGGWLGMRATIQSLADQFATSSAYDAEMLGPGYQAFDTNFEKLSQDLDWVEVLRNQLQGQPSSIVAVAQLDSAHADVADGLLRAWTNILDTVCAEFSPAYAEHVRSELLSDYDGVQSYLQLFVSTLDDIAEWGTYQRASDGLRKYGLAKALDYSVESRVSREKLSGVLQRSMLDQWLDQVLRADARLAEYRGKQRDQLVAKFRELDSQVASLGTAHAVRTCNAKRPTAAFGATALVQGEAMKQRRHMPTRTLMERAGPVIQALKPCMMMSPLSVSQFLPSSMQFDVVIFDEASQVRPADAVNCVYRGHQLIVAGDSKQLPPTAFFERGDDTSEEWDEDQLDDFQSVLDLAKGAGALTTMSLRWHYRSQHEDLITYSNYSFYDGQLVTFPAAKISASDVGLELFSVPGVYRRGGARDNPVEARKVVERLLFHLTNHPENSIGVVAFSEAQASAIDHEIDLAIPKNPQLERMRSEDRLLGGFVKNLESVQGDERDTIIFSVGYGPDEAGRFTLNFGPVTRPGGVRRLNVAITRARKRVEVVSSIAPSLFANVGDSSSEGVRHLRRYLDYVSRTDNRMASLAINLGTVGRDSESPFEEEVARVIRSWGFDVTPQVGCADYRIDIGVRHPDFRDVYVMGVECDGAMYHSSKVARDRDRLREEVLRKLGWARLHRIWGISWYSDRGAEEVRLRNALEAAIGQHGSPSAFVGPAYNETIATTEHGVELSTTPDWVALYEVCQLTPPRVTGEIHEGIAQPELRRMVLEVVRVEGPVLPELVLRRVRQAWGLQRAGNRARTAFDAAVRWLKLQKEVDIDRDGFLIRPHFTLQTVRGGDPKQADTIRSVAEVPPSELQQALLRFVGDSHGITDEELTARVADVFGWARRGPDIAATLRNALTTLARGRQVRRQGDILRLA